MTGADGTERERWKQVDDLLAAALERNGEERERFLDESCGAGTTLRRELDSLLRCAEAANDFLEQPPAGAATVVLTATDAPPTPSARRALDDTRFIPGDIVAGRYRIAGLLGRGGMGEVYRADDLKLEQPVALKFLSESLARNGGELARFHREVSLARQVSHRHVCRVYDIGEHGGMHFLSMEWVRGEELSSLLKRVGRLPLEKATETARQLCAGLTAIHAAWVVHRDLKPANVMIDERGDVRITDFGIAALGDSEARRELIGTPAYMAPELLRGGEATPRSDIYALGLVLYEAFTGNRPYEARTLEEVIRIQTDGTPPTRPSTWVTGLDPLVERVILRCLDHDPARRPATALDVAAALPGGDPLAAALAAGETPSPQMVAAAPSPAALAPHKAVLLLLAIAAALAVIAFSSRQALHSLLPLQRPAVVLRSTATDIVEDAARARPFDAASGFELNGGVRDWIASHDSSSRRWTRLRETPLPVVTFWYRASPEPLVANSFGGIDMFDPPNSDAGMVRLRLDTTGRLLLFEQVPPASSADGGRAAVDWTPFFGRAGIDASALRPARPERVPAVAADTQQAWTGSWPGRPDLPLRVEAASYHGVPVLFRMIGPWDAPPGAGGRTPNRTPIVILLTLYFSALAGGALLAWRNFRLGRGDRRGAFRLMIFTFATRLMLWAFSTHHVPSLGEIGHVLGGLENAVYWAALVGLLYLALEPFIRRRWPHRLIAWTRVLAGDVRDPLVGRDILFGGVFGTALIVSMSLFTLIPQLAGRPLPHPPHASELVYRYGFDGVAGFVKLLLTQLSAATLFPLILLSLVLFLSVITRSEKAGVAIVWLAVYLLAATNFGDGSLLAFAIAAIPATLLLFVLVRFGLFALSTTLFTVHLWAFYPVTTDLTAWYATSFLLQLATIVALLLFGFRTALAGNRLFETAWLD